MSEGSPNHKNLSTASLPDTGQSMKSFGILVKDKSLMEQKRNVQTSPSNFTKRVSNTEKKGTLKNKT